MKVHLIRSDNVADYVYFGVKELLQEIPGPFEFLVNEQPAEITISDEVRELFPDEKGFDEKQEIVFESNAMLYLEKDAEYQQLSWEDLLSANFSYRKRNHVNEKDTVILLTEYGNHENWFSGFDKKEHSKDFFIQTGLWEHYVTRDNRYPVAYQIIGLLLKQRMFSRPDELVTAMHRTPRGCLLDFCKNKKEISLKMRTADVCPDCLKHIRERNVPLEEVRFIFRMLDHIRTQLLYRERYTALRSPLPLVLKGRRKEPCIPELGNLRFGFQPGELAIYLLFLHHPEGIRMSEVIDHRSELLGYMNLVSRRDDPEMIQRMVDELCNAQSNSLSEKMSRIKNKISNLLGESLADFYIISGPNGGHKKINLPRNLVSEE